VRVTARPRRPLTRGVAAASLVLLLVVPAIAPGQATEPLTVTVNASGVSLTAVDAPLDQVLARLGQAVKAKIVVETVLAADLARTRVTRSFTDVPPIVAFGRLLAGRNYALIQGPQGVDEVRVFVDGKTGYRDLQAPARASRRPPRPVIDSRDGDPVDVARLREVALGAPDADERRQALEDLSINSEVGMLRDTLTQALARERDGRVLEAVVEIAAQNPEALPAEALRAFVASDRDPAARSLAVHHLVAHDEGDPATRNLLRTIATGDPSEDVRAAAESALEMLDAGAGTPAGGGRRGRGRP
jgi:hypothetical protein